MVNPKNIYNGKSSFTFHPLLCHKLPSANLPLLLPEPKYRVFHVEQCVKTYPVRVCGPRRQCEMYPCLEQRKISHALKRDRVRASSFGQVGM
mmetsp:Transcript_11889/g.16428  ORF Transcript_11889/g.16428 Transcript_11889/m.16428 type:complete len:92 (+) Transcript_11889:159-434(+)